MSVSTKTKLRSFEELGLLASTDPVAPHVTNAKAEQYGWCVLDRPGRFMMIHKDLLRIDHAYQREGVKKDRVVKISKGLRWAEFGALCVAARVDGTFSIIDGQHRYLAASRIPSIGALPCMVYDVAAVDEEARAFLGINSGRTSVGSVDRFKASLVCGDDLSQRLLALADQCGIRICNTRQNGTIACVALLQQCAKADWPALEKVLPLAVSLNEGLTVHERILAALFYLYKQHGDALLHKAIVNRLMVVGRAGLLVATERAAAEHSRGGPKIWAKGVLAIINKGMRTNRLVATAGSDD